MWSDTFLWCFIKQKENSLWIITVTVCPLENKKSRGLYTYVLAMDKSSEDHTGIIDFYPEQIMELNKGSVCYFGGIDTIELQYIVWWYTMLIDLEGK